MPAKLRERGLKKKITFPPVTGIMSGRVQAPGFLLYLFKQPLIGVLLCRARVLWGRSPPALAFWGAAWSLSPRSHRVPSHPHHPAAPGLGSTRAMAPGVENGNQEWPVAPAHPSTWDTVHPHVYQEELFEGILPAAQGA